jgi:hypothetical protein
MRRLADAVATTVGINGDCGVINQTNKNNTTKNNKTNKK